MALVLFHNHGPTAVYIGGRTVPPGEAREVDAALVPVATESQPQASLSDAGEPGAEGGRTPDDRDLDQPAAGSDTPMIPLNPTAPSPLKGRRKPL